MLGSNSRYEFWCLRVRVQSPECLKHVVCLGQAVFKGLKVIRKNYNSPCCSVAKIECLSMSAKP